jgi:hypothetical protein
MELGDRSHDAEAI